MTFDEAKAYLIKRCGKWGQTDIGDDLYVPAWHMSWFSNNSWATLDGEFSADDLIAIGTYMMKRQHETEK